MNFENLLFAFSSGIILGCAIYLCFSKNLFRMTLAVFVMTCCLAAILVEMNQDFLGGFLILVSSFVVALAATFTKVLNGDLRAIRESPVSLFGKMTPPLVGAVFAFVLSKELIQIYESKAPLINADGATTKGPDLLSLGTIISGDHPIVFLLMGTAILVISMGLTQMLWGNANE